MKRIDDDLDNNMRAEGLFETLVLHCIPVRASRSLRDKVAHMLALSTGHDTAFSSLSSSDLVMSNFYTTKSLGKEWLPSPIRPSQRGRFGSWTSHDEEHAPAALVYGPQRTGEWKRWSRIHERILMAMVLLLMLGWWGCAGGRMGGFHFRGGGRGGGKVMGMEMVEVNWHDFAYITYATQMEYLCNSVMLLESLVRLGVKADLLLLYDHTLELDLLALRLLAKAREEFGAKLKAVDVQILPPAEGQVPSTWTSSSLKLLAFNQTQYQRVLMLDSDSTVLQSMDELFLLPSARVAMPRAYWSQWSERAAMPEFCDAIALIEPSSAEWEVVHEAIDSREERESDAKTMNRLYGPEVMVLPHRGYALLTGEFAAEDHGPYLGIPGETRDAEEVLTEAKFVHFSDYPLPKPWAAVEEAMVESARPKCRVVDEDGGKECKDRGVWEALRREFKARRKVS